MIYLQLQFNEHIIPFFIFLFKINFQLKTYKSTYDNYKIIFYIIIYNMSVSLGGGIQGSSKVGFANTQKDAETAIKRKLLRKAFFKTTKVGDIKPLTGPFRASFNQGDILNRQYQTCGGSNQLNGTNSSILRPKMADSINNSYCNAVTCGKTPLEVPLFSGNSKYVCDSSLFTKFKQLETINSNYNDKSFGGNDHNGSYSFLKNLR